MKEPLVSVIVLTYNHERFIKKCLEGLKAQETDFEFEVILSDDVSRDHTAEICRRIAREDPRIHYHQNVKNEGAARNFKKALQRSRGKYIASCEGDDFWSRPDKLQIQVDLLQRNPGTSMVYANYGKVGPDGRELEASVLPAGHRAISLKEMVEKSGPSTNSIVIRRTAYPTEFPRAFFTVPNPDVFIMAWALQAGAAHYHPEVLSMYRVHPAGLWTSKSKDEQQLIFFSTRMAMYSSLGWSYTRLAETCKEGFKKTLARVYRSGNKALFKDYLVKLPMDEQLVFRGRLFFG